MASGWRRRKDQVMHSYARLLTEPLTRNGRAGWRYALLGWPLALVGFVFAAASLGFGVYAAITIVGLPLLAASTPGLRWFGVVYRNRARRLLGARVPEPPPFRPARGIVGWTRSALTDAVAWRARAYLVLKLPVSTAGFVAAACYWLLGPYYLTYPLWWEVFHGFTYRPRPGASPIPVLATPLPGNLEILTWPTTLPVIFAGAAIMLAAPRVLRAANALDVSLIGLLLGETRSQRVRELERSRANAVQDSAARLRGIERDLHDGTQARLVAVTMRLGMAKDKLRGPGAAGGEPDVGRAYELVDIAQHTVREAMEELRGLVRGIHPPALDAGLDVALTSLAARSAVPVELVIDMPRRAPAPIEAIAYFCAAELLANVAKHSKARRAVLEVVHIPGLLRVRVTDDGVGGAMADANGGLRGLHDRVGTVDGTLEVSSPRGGPTVATVELPTEA
jgi:signal transduction histidine kinase